MRKFIDISRGSKEERGRCQTKSGRYASLVCCNGQGRGVLKFTRLDGKRDARHLTSGRTSGEVLGILGSTMLDAEGLAREKVWSDCGSAFVLID